MKESPLKAESDEGPKFLFCLSVQNGVRIIGLLEIFATFVQIMNMYFSYRVSIALLVFINLPLLCAYGMMFKAKKDGDIEGAYKWNSRFIWIYSIRCTVIFIGGIVGILISQYSDTSMDFFCDRYGGHDFEAYAKMKGAEKKETSLEIEECRHFVRNFLIIMYIPILVF
tara:strand:+ start:170 stop:676 length:507 start_codon:yes stop_codon:yes gene_type:complete